MNEALDALEASLEEATQQALSPSRERRRFERKPYFRTHLVGPIIRGRVPSPEMFQEVQFFDLSTGGFGMLMAAPPTFKNLIVALDKNDGTVYALAEVVRLRRSEQSDGSGGRMWEVGCRFMGKLQSMHDAPASNASQAVQS